MSILYNYYRVGQMVKNKAVDYLLSFSLLIFFFICILLVTNEVFEIALLKCSCLALIAFVFYLFSIMCKHLLNADISNKVSYLLGSITVVIFYYVLGNNKYLSPLFSVNSYGSLLFLASIFLLITMLFVITMIIYKNNKYIHFIFISVFITFLFLINYFVNNLDISILNLCLVILVPLISLVDLGINVFEVIQDKYIKISYKFFITAILFSSVLIIPFYFRAHTISILFILICSVISTYGLHTNDYEEYFLPFKHSLLLYLLFHVLGIYIIPLMALIIIMIVIGSKLYQKKKVSL